MYLCEEFTCLWKECRSQNKTAKFNSEIFFSFFVRDRAKVQKLQSEI